MTSVDTSFARSSSPHIVLTGAAGFVGRNLLKKLLLQGRTVLATDIKGLDALSRRNLKPLIDQAKKRGQFQYLQGDIRDYRFCASLLRKGDTLVHQAALTSVEDSRRIPDEYHKTNVLAFQNLCQAAVEAEIKTIVYASSAAAKNYTPSQGYNQDHCSPYGVSKYYNEELARSVSKRHRIPVIGLRYFNILGSDEHWIQSSNAVVAKWFREAVAHGRITIFGDGEQTRDFCSIDFVVESNIAAIENSSEDAQHIIAEIGSGEPISINELAGKFCNVFETVFPDSEQPIIFHELNSASGARESTSDISTVLSNGSLKESARSVESMLIELFNNLKGQINSS